MFKNEDIKLVKVPRIPELSAKKLIEDASRDRELRIYLPELVDTETRAHKHVNR
jgi:hypothetical protein